MLIAVTGATGFVGGRLVRDLTERGHDVVAFGRRSVGTIPGTAAYIRWDLAEGPLETRFEPEVVVHCAGTVSDWGPDETFYRVNVDGTRAVLRAFPDAPRFVHVSSASVYDAAVPKREVPEDAPYATAYQNAYARTKMLAERAVGECGRPAVILRPHAVYGPGDRTLLPRLLAARRFGYLLAVGNGCNTLSVTHVDNLVHAIVRAIEGDVDAGTFNIADPAVATLDQLLHTLLRRLGLPARVAYIPLEVAAPAAVLLDRAYRLARARRAPLLTPYIVSQLCSDYTLDIRKARRVLGYCPRYTYLDGPLGLGMS